MKKIVALCFLLVGCKGVAWPRVVSCADELEQPLVAAVEQVLAGDADVESALADIARRYSPSLVECAVEQLLSKVGDSPSAAQSHEAARGHAFLVKVHQ